MACSFTGVVWCAWSGVWSGLHCSTPRSTPLYTAQPRAPRRSTPQAISNQLFGLFSPSLSDSANYIEDEPSFRREVAWSFVVSYFFAFLSLALLPLLPRQKDEAQYRKHNWESRDAYAYTSVSIIFVGLFYSVTVNMLAMFPETMCLKIAGGSGC